MKYQTPQAWLKDCGKLLREDNDNLFLFEGPEGAGKSTIAFQIMRALDREFTQERMMFGIANFLAGVDDVPRYGAVLADELEASSRAGMTTLSQDLIRFLKDCRGRNLNIGLCYPHAHRLDRAILEDRVRWRVEVPKRGLFIVRERSARKVFDKHGRQEIVVTWPERGRWSFKPNAADHPIWAAYKAKKELHMTSLGEKYREGSGAAAGGVDHAGAVGFFRDALSAYEERRGGGAAIQEIP